jgi:hypothetical protein
VADQAEPDEGVVLVLGDKVPGQDGHLAGGGHDGGLEAAAGLDALAKGAQRPGGVAGGPGRPDQHAADLDAADLADPAVHRRGVPGLADLRVQPDIDDELVSVTTWCAIGVITVLYRRRLRTSDLGCE